MSIEILSISRKPTNWVKQAIDDYLVRFPTNVAPKMTYLAPARGRLSAREKLAREARSVLGRLEQRDIVIVLDATGFLLTNKSLIQKLKRFSETDEKLKLIIGGAEGLDTSVKKRAYEIWSLSALIFPHKIIQIMLVEQLYRSRSIDVGHPYHRS